MHKIDHNKRPSIQLDSYESPPKPTLISQPPLTAAGFPALASTLHQVLSKPGLVTGVSNLLKLNQKGGVDCSSCAWPDPQGHRSIAEFCENGAKAMADETTRAKVTPDFFRNYSIQELSQRDDYWLNQQGRLTHPVYLAPESNHYQPISWEQAFHLIGTKLKSLSDPNRAVFYTSGRTSNEAAFLYQLFVRAFGTNNLPDCSNLCHESSGKALSAAIGIGKGTVTLKDFEQTDLILVVGQNPGTNHPRMLTSLEKAKEAGAKIVSINPLAEAGLNKFINPQKFLNPIEGVKTLVAGGTQLSDLHIPIKIQGDEALTKAILATLIQDYPESLNRSFIEEKTIGFDPLKHSLKDLDIYGLLATAGVSIEQFNELIQYLVHSDRIIICWAMGITQQPNAVAIIQDLVNLLLLKGSIGIAGGGVCPVRGHSNVQGDRTMGIWEHPPESFLQQLEEVFRFSPPRQVGYNAVQTISAMLEDKVDVFMAMGGNFLSASPDTYRTAEGLQRCQLTVSVSTKLNRSHLCVGQESLILPCLVRSEVDKQVEGAQFQTVENSMGFVHRTQGSLPPASPQLLSEIAIIAGIAEATLGAHPIHWNRAVDNYTLIRNWIEQTIPGFEQYDHRVRNDYGFYLPNGPRDGIFPTPSGKAVFHANSLREDLESAGEYTLMTMRSHDQYNTTIYGYQDRYRGVDNLRRVLFMHPQDMQEKNLEELDLVTITSHFQGIQRTVDYFKVIPYEIPHGCVAAYFPEANPLVPLESYADKSFTPTSKFVRVSIQHSS